MVRKWSYLENSTPDFGMYKLDSVSSLYHFKVFRKTTRFKKFNRGITKMVRKNYARRKHRTNWLVLSYITKSWVSNYLKMRQFERFFSGLTRFTINSFSADVSVFKLKVKELNNQGGINILSCSQTPITRYLKYSQGASFLLNPTKNTNNTLIQTSSADSLSNSLEVFPNLMVLENHTYSYTDASTLETIVSSSTLESTLTPSVLSTTNSITSSVYSIVVVLALFNVHR